MLYRTAAAAGALVLLLAGCDALSSGLSASSTCEEFNDASPEQQGVAIRSLVQAAEGGGINPFREANAVMQISHFCAQPGSEDTALRTIPI